MREPKIITIDKSNVDEYGVGCIRTRKHGGYRAKREWLDRAFKDGLKMKIAVAPDGKQSGFIEYVPGEKTWRGVKASGHMVIHCIWNGLWGRKYQHKGYGTKLLKEVINEAKKEKMKGVVKVTSEGPWLAGKELFIKNGFKSVDTAPPSFEVLVKKFTKSAKTPKFIGGWEKRLEKYNPGLYVIYANQCPYHDQCVKVIAETAKDYGLKAKLMELKTPNEAQTKSPSPYGTFGLVYNGKLLSYHYVSRGRFKNILGKDLKLKKK
jgi:L-amino acid N-acyltransferase YncA